MKNSSANTIGLARSPSAGGLSSTASGLKLRVQNVARSLQNQTDALGEDRTRIDHVKSSAASSNHGLNKELENTQKFFQVELQQMEEDFKAKVGVQKNENIRLQQCLTTLKTEKTMLHQQIIAMQHMVDELEEEIGSE